MKTEIRSISICLLLFVAILSNLSPLNAQMFGVGYMAAQPFYGGLPPADYGSLGSNPVSGVYMMCSFNCGRG
ncbi:hypothetical protein Ddc_18863 [Ditylenchus destructor]|nr:hypothetical protein Ddc_18863 [Ditylenchus destructor]